MEYAVFFSVEGMTIRLPTNPEEIQISEGQEIEEFKILELGKIAVPSVMDLKQYSFEVELPSKMQNYVVTKQELREPSFYLELFRTWRKEKKPIRFIASNGIQDISELVLVESLQTTEKSGEEGDYYVSLNLKQYRPYNLKEAVSTKDEEIAIYTTPTRMAEPPKPAGNIYVITQGDTLWAIAKRYLGDGNRYPEIHKLNQPPLGTNPNLIYPGQKIKVPEV